MKLRVLFLLAMSLLAAVGWGQDLRYTVVPKPQADRTDLEIVVRWQEEAGKETEIGLPQDFYGVNDLWTYVASITGEEGTTVAPGKTPRFRTVTPGVDGKVAIRYRMSYPPKDMEDLSFGPIVTPVQVQTFLCQWMLRIGDLRADRGFELAVENVPKEWKVYSTLAPGTRRFSMRASYERLISAVLGAGDVADQHFEVEGKPVALYLARSLKLKPETILRKVESVVRTERAWFNDHSKPYYMVSISVRPDNVAGTAVGPGFVCFVKDDVTESQLLMLLSHEMLHNWLPGRIHVTNPGETERWMWEWFDEGFDEYFARRVLLESKAIDKATFAGLLNDDLRNIADNPERNTSYAEVKTAFAEGRFSVAHKKLSYYRGALLASIWNARIVARSGGKRSLADVLRRMFAESSKAGGELAQDRFYALLREEGIDAKADQNRYILHGETITPSPNALGPDFRLAPRPHRLFDPGFEVSESLRTHRIVGLAPGGPAERAGLREDMKLERVQNSNRFGNAWDRRRPFSAWVEIDGKVRRIDYMPLGKEIQLLQYVRR